MSWANEQDDVMVDKGGALGLVGLWLKEESGFRTRLPRARSCP